MKNLTIKDFAMLALSLLLLVVIALATCAHHDHEHNHSPKRDKNFEASEKDMSEFWHQTQNHEADQTDFGEPMDELVDALTNADNTQENETPQKNQTAIVPPQEKQETETATVDTQTIETVQEAAIINDHEAVIDEAITIQGIENDEDIAELEASLNEIVISTPEDAITTTNTVTSEETAELEASLNEAAAGIQEEHPTENRTKAEKIGIKDNRLGMIKEEQAEPHATEDAIDQALLADIALPATANKDEIASKNEVKLKSCMGEDSKTQSLEAWRAHLKAKIKTLLQQDDESGCVDVLLEELYLSS